MIFAANVRVPLWQAKCARDSLPRQKQQLSVCRAQAPPVRVIVVVCAHATQTRSISSKSPENRPDVRCFPPLPAPLLFDVEDAYEDGA